MRAVVLVLCVLLLLPIEARRQHVLTMLRPPHRLLFICHVLQVRVQSFLVVHCHGLHGVERVLLGTRVEPVHDASDL